MTSHCITWHDTTQAITSHQMKWPWHDLTPQQTSRHQNTSLQSTKHHHHGTAEGSFTAKKWFGHRAGRSPCAHSIGKFFLCYIVLFLVEASAPGLSGHYWYNHIIKSYPHVSISIQNAESERRRARLTAKTLQETHFWSKTLQFQVSARVVLFDCVSFMLFAKRDISCNWMR